MLMSFFRGSDCFIILFFLLIPLAKAQTNQGLSSTVHPNNESHNPLQSCAPPEEAEIYQKRLGEYQKAVAEDPQTPKYHHNLGILYSRLQQWEEAQKSFFQALAHNPKKTLKPQIYHHLGNLYACLQQFDKAIAQYKQTLRANPQDEDAKYNLALSQLLAQQQKQEQAQEQQNQGSENKESDQQKEEPGKQQNSSDEEQTASAQENSPEDAQDQQTAASQSSKENPPEDQTEQTAASSDTADNSAEEPSPAPSEQATAESEENGQASLTRQQAEQLINTVLEDRREFIQRLLERQPPPSSSGKAW